MWRPEPPCDPRVLLGTRAQSPAGCVWTGEPLRGVWTSHPGAHMAMAPSGCQPRSCCRPPHLCFQPPSSPRWPVCGQSQDLRLISCPYALLVHQEPHWLPERRAEGHVPGRINRKPHRLGLQASKGTTMAPSFNVQTVVTRQLSGRCPSEPH